MVKLYRGLCLAVLLILISRINVFAAVCDVELKGKLIICPGSTTVLTAETDAKSPTYQWMKDGADITNAKASTYTVTQVGKYSVKVKGEDCDEKASSEVTVTVDTNPSSDFTFSSGACSGVNINFNGPSGTGLTYSWDFGDGGAGSTSRTPSRAFNPSNGSGAQTYNVKLVVTNSNGCKSETVNQVSINRRPVVDFKDAGAGPFDTPFLKCAEGASNYVLNIQNSSSTAGASFSINWGDGQTQNLGTSFSSVTHTYTQQGAFNLVVTATGANGCTSSKTVQVFNGSNPSISVGSPGNTVGCGPVTYTFPISGVNTNSPATVYTFEFDDGSAPYIFTQENIPASLPHTFLKSSCGKPGNAFTLKAKAENPCGTTEVTVGSIRIAAKPTADFTLSPASTSACLNDTYLLDGSTASAGSNILTNGTCSTIALYQWEITPATGWTVTSGTLTSINPRVKFTEKGNYSIKFTITNNCASASATKSVTIYEPPVAKFTTTFNPTNGCKNLSVVTANQSTGEFLTFKWTVTPNTGYTITSGSLTSATPTFNFTTGGVYTINLEASNQCGSSTASTQVTVKSPPVVTLPTAKEYCGPQTIPFTTGNVAHTPTFAANFGTITAYNWTVTGGTGATFVSPSTNTSQYPTINFANPGTFTVTLTATNECGVSNTASQQLIIRALPTPPVLADKTICEGSGAGLAVSNPVTGSTYKWYNAATSGTLLAAGTTYNPTPSNTTTYYVEVTDQFGCISATRTPVTVTVNKQIANNTITGPNPSIICEGETPAIITGSQPTGGDGSNYTYQWERSTTSSSTGFTAIASSNTKDFAPGALTQTTYFRRLITSGVCSTSTSSAITITVTPRPTAPTVAGTTICSGSTTTLAVTNPPAGYTYRWFTVSTGGVSITTSNTYTTPALTTTTTYYVESVSSNCASFTRTSVTVTVTPAITSNAISDNQDICTGQAAQQLVGQPAVGGTGAFVYSWEFSQSSASDGFTSVASNGTGLSYSPGVLTAPTWFRRKATSGACSTYSNVVEIKVRPVISNNTLASDQTICAGAIPPKFTGSSPAGGNNSYTYKWEISTTSADAGYSIIGSATDKDYQPIALNVTTWFRRIVGSGACASITSAPVKVTVQQPIANNSISGNQTICKDQPAQPIAGVLPTGGSGVYTYQWQSSTLENGTYTNVTGATDVTLSFGTGQSPTVTTWYRRLVTAGVCATSQSNLVKITVNPAITNNTITNNTTQTICTGTAPAALVGATPGGGDGLYAYQWQISINNTSFTDILNATGKDYAPGNLTQTTWFKRAVTSGGCTALSTAVQIVVQPQIATNTISGNQGICAGSAPALFTGSAPTGGSGSYLFQWQSSTNGTDFADITGATAQNYQAPTLTTSTWYRRIVSAGACVANTSLVTKVDVTAPITNNSISVVPATICSGAAPAMIVGSDPAGATGTFTYVWERSTTSNPADFVVISGATGRDYTSGALTQTTWFRRKAASGACTVTSAVLQITVQVPAANNSITAAQSLCEGTAAAALIGSTPTAGTGTFTYVWERSTTSATANDFEVLSGATGKDYSPGTLLQSTWFRRKVFSGACSEITSNVILVEITKAITTNNITADQTICAGNRPANLVGALPQGGNTIYAYQWQMSINGSAFSNITGVTSKDYHPEALTVTTWYQRVVTSGACSVVSAAVKITVTPLPAAPTVAGKTICANTSTSLTATGSGDTYRWYATATGGPALFEGPTFTTPVLTQTATYFVETVKTGCASSTRTAVTVTVDQPITNNTISAAQTICVGNIPQGLTGTMPTGGSGSYTYLWESSADGTSFTPVSGATSASYSPGVLNATTYYRRVVTAGICTASTSSTIKITVNPAITNNTVGSVSAICAGQSPALLTGSTPGGGDGAYIYSWESSTTSATAGFTGITGAAGATYQPLSLTTTTWFRRIISSGGCAVTSTAVRVEVQAPIDNNTVATAQNICSGATPAALTGSTPSGGAAVGATATYSYRWEASTTSATAGFTAISGATAIHYSPSILTETTWFRRVVLAGVCAENVSEAVKINVTPPITANTLSNGQTICSGGTPALIIGSSPAGGEGNLYAYSWEMSTSGSTYTAIGGATGKDYQPGALTTTTWYRRTVKSGACTVTSSATKVTVTPLPAAPTVAAQTICAGATATLSASGSGTTYRWYAATTGSTILFDGATFITPALTQTTTYYVETVKDDCASALRTAVTVTVEQPIASNAISGPQEICEGAVPQTFTGTTPTGGTGTYTYVWERSTDDVTYTTIAISNAKDYTAGALSQTTWFRRKVTSGVCTVSVSVAVKVTVNSGIGGNSISSAQTICAGQAPVKLTGGSISGGGSGYTYQWQVSSDGGAFSDITGATAADYEPGVLNENRWYRRKVISGGCSSTSAAIKVEVQQPIANNSITAAQAICSGAAPATLVGSVPAGGVQTGGTATYTYEWQSSADGGTFSAIAGATSKDYAPGILTQTTWYRRVAKAGVCTESVSVAIKIDVTQPITTNTLSANQTICYNIAPGKIIGSSPAGGNNTYTYVWQQSTDGSVFTTISGAIDKDHQPGILTASTWFRRVVSSGQCMVTSLAMKVTVTPLPAAPTVPAKTICASFTAKLDAVGSGDTYRWYTAATGGVSLHEGATFTTPPLAQSTTYYVETIKDECASATRTAVKVTVEQPIANNSISAAQEICEGAIPLPFEGSVPTGGVETGTTPGYTYKWLKSTNNLTYVAANGTSKDFASAALAQTTWFKRVVSSGVCAADTSGAIKVTVNAGIAGNTITAAQTICAGQTPAIVGGGTLTGGGAAYTYQWQSSIDGATFVNIANANALAYSPGTLTASTWFQRVVTSGGCASTSNKVKIEVQQPIANNSISAAQFICSGAVPTSISGSTPTNGAETGTTATYVYEWFVSTDGTVFNKINGATSKDYAPAALTQSAWYKRTVKAGVCNESESNVIKIDVTQPITANTLSPDQIICSSTAPAKLEGSMPQGGNGTTYTYAWEMSTTSSSTGFTTITGVAEKDYQPGVLTQTTWYRRIVRSGACTVTSATLKVTVTPLPAAPTVAAKTICASSSAELTAVGDGDTYKWYITANGGTAVHTGAIFTTPALTQSTSYYVETIKDNCASASRTAVKVTVEQPIAGNSISAAQEICEGATPQPFVGSTPTGGSEAGTTPVYTYQWLKSTNGTTYSLVIGATSQSYAATALNENTWFKRIVSTGICKADTTLAIKVTVNPGISGNSITAAQVICANQIPETLKGGALTGGGTTYTYQWQRSTDGFTFTNISTNATSADYSPGALVATIWYRRVVTSGGCTSTSNAIKIEVQQPIAGNTISAAQFICSGSTPAGLLGTLPTGGTETGGNAIYTYEWQSSADGTTFTKVNGAASKDFSPEILTQHTWYRRVVRAGVCQESISNVIKIDVTQPITANSLSINQVICNNTAPDKIEGSNAQGGNGTTYAYQWQSSTDGVTFANISGAEGKDYQPSVLTATTWYRRLVVSGACTVTSAAMKVEVTPLPAAPGVSATSVTTICTGFNTTLTATGSADKYLWYTAATGGTALHEGPSFQTPNLTQTTTYYVESVKDKCASATRTAVMVTVEQLIANNTISAQQVICAGAIPAPLTGTLPTGGTGTYTYRWEMSTTDATTAFVIISNATAQDYAPTALSQTTWFRRVTISGVCSEHVSAAIKVTVNPGITGNTISGNQRACIGSEPATKLTGLVPSGGDAAYTYRWESSTVSATNGFAEAMGANNGQDYKAGALAQTTWYRRVVISGGCTSYSEAVRILVDPLPNPPVSPDKIICSGFTATLTVNSPVATNTYEWFTASLGGTPVAEGVTFVTQVLTTTSTFYVQVTDVNGCVSPRTAVRVTVNPVISNNTVSARQEICSGVVPQPLSGTAPIGGDGTYVYLWEFSTDNNSFNPAPGNNAAKDYAPAALNVTTWYRRKIASGGCNDTSPTVQIVVNSPIASNVISPEQDICEGDTPQLLTATNPTGGNGVYTYRWESNIIGPLGDFKSATGNNAKESFQSGALTQTTWFRRVVISGGCENVSAALEVVVRESIKNNQISSPQIICYGNAPADVQGSLPTGGNGIFEYVWEASTLSATSGFALAAGNHTQQNYSPGIMTQTTWYRRVVKAGTSCPVVISNAIKITVNEAITNNAITTSQVICTGTRPAVLGGAIPAGGSGSYTYQWQVSYTGLNDFMPAEGLNSEVNYAPPVLTRNTWFRRIVLSAPCPAQASNVVMITVNPLITNNVVQKAQTICERTAPAQFLGMVPGGGDGTYSYLWQVSEDGPTSGFTAASGMNTSINYQAPALTQNTWFRRVVMSGNCADTSAAVQVTVNRNIANNVVSEAQEICVGATPMPLSGTMPTGGNGNYTYLWESSIVGPNSGFGPARGVNTDPNYIPELVLQTTWFRRVVSAGPCDPQYSVSVRIRINPPISNNRISFNQAICAGTLPAALTGTAPQGGNGEYTYLWEESPVGPNSGWKPAEDENTTANYQPGYLARTTWFRRTVFSGGCVNTSAYIQVTVLPALSNNLISADQLICRGDAPQAINGIQPIGGSGTYTYLWESSIDGLNYTTAIGDNTGLNYRSGPLSVSTWFRRVVTSTPCAEDISTPVKITVAAPISNNMIASDQAICSGLAPNLLQGSMPAGGGSAYTYLWEISTNGPTAGFAAAPGKNTDRDYQPGVLTQSTWFRRVVTSLPCQSQTSALVKVTVNPLPAAPVWQNPGARICPGFTALLRVNNPGQQIEWYEQAQGGAVIHTGTSFTTPSLTETTTYYVQTVSAQGCASATRTAIKVEVVQPLANAGQDVTIIQGRTTQLRASGGVRYVWSPAVNLSSPNTAVTQAKPEETTTYTVRVTSAEGCESTDEVTVTVLPKVFIPNVITQNKDGVNDDWEILNIEHYPNCRVEIFTRWGAKIFSSDGYQTRWDGTYQGKPLPVSAYYYILYLDKGEAPISGSITIIK